MDTSLEGSRRGVRPISGGHAQDGEPGIGRLRVDSRQPLGESSSGARLPAIPLEDTGAGDVVVGEELDREAQRFQNLVKGLCRDAFFAAFTSVNLGFPSRLSFLPRHVPPGFLGMLSNPNDGDELPQARGEQAEALVARRTRQRVLVRRQHPPGRTNRAASFKTRAASSQ